MRILTRECIYIFYILDGVPKMGVVCVCVVSGGGGLGVDAKAVGLTLTCSYRTTHG